MLRVNLDPRNNWQHSLENLGFAYHTQNNEKYWNESAFYAFSEKEINHIEQVANDVHQKCLYAVDFIIKNKLYAEFNIPNNVIPLIEHSWNTKQPHLYGRFDFSYDLKNNQIKLLEYNADTPTALFEASIAQWHWLEDNLNNRPNDLQQRLDHYGINTNYTKLDQFNFIHEQLFAQWLNIINYLKNNSAIDPKVYFTCCTDYQEDLVTTEYLADVYTQAYAEVFPDNGLKSLSDLLIDIADIGWDNKNFTDLKENKIKNLFKLYPWEWLIREDFGQHLKHDSTLWIEPYWKMLLSNKAILKILWDLFPNHPNLSPAHFDLAQLPDRNNYIKKPLLGREGSNISIVNNQQNLSNDGPYGDEGYIYQQYVPSTSLDNYYPVLGVWMVGDVACGLGIREDQSPITNNLSHFVPHCFY